MTPSALPQRRHDLDALRAAAMLLGVALHAALSFMPMLWPVQDSRQSDVFGLFFSAIHGFRMPLFFLVSGFFTAMIYKKRGWRALATHRFRRILLPLILASATVLPLTAWVSKHVAAAPSEESMRDALHYVTAAGDSRTLRSMLDDGADPNSRSAQGATLLHGAAFFGRSEVVALLLSRGADPGLRDTGGLTPIEVLESGWELTQSIADLYNIPVDRIKVVLGRQEAAAFLSGGVVPAPPTAGSELHAILHAPLLGHLWFLWHLCWLIAGFLICAPLTEHLPTSQSGGFLEKLVLSPLRYLWLVPITAIAQWAMAPLFPSFGPDTSISLLPDIAVLSYYAIFFGFGALYFGAADRDGKLGRYWWLELPIALLAIFPIGMFLIYAKEPALGTMRQPLAAIVQVSYAWLMASASIGFFRKLLSRKNPTLRYISDSSYWLYLAHIPLVIAAQALVRDWPFPAFPKFIFVCVVVAGILLISYQWCVRYTWLGTLLNGPRARPQR